MTLRTRQSGPNCTRPFVVKAAKTNNSVYYPVPEPPPDYPRCDSDRTSERLALKSRDVDSVDPYVVLGVFLYCSCGKDHSILPCDDDDYDSMADDVYVYEREKMYGIIITVIR